MLCCLVATAVATAVTSWFWCFYFRRKASAESSAETRRAMEVLIRLQELAARVAFDVDDHNNHLGEIGERLTSTDQHDPAMIIEVVAKLIQANELMHMKLNSTEGKLREQAEEIQTFAAEARTDAVTLLANRRAFDDELARRTAEHARQGRTFSLIMADVDHFKRFNDAYGHQTGDEVLRAMAKLLRRKMREMDLVVRYGGEEFAVILPGTNANEACRAALRACEAIEESRFHHEGKEIQVTASFGVAEVGGSSDGAALIGRADKALYAAKKDGRHCVFWDDGKNVRRAGAEQLSPPAAAAVQPPPAPVPVEQVANEKSEPATDAPRTEPEPDLPALTDLGTIPDFPSRTTFCQNVRNRTAEWRRGGPTFSVVLLEVNQYIEGAADRGKRMREFATQTTTRFLAATMRDMDVVGCYAPGCFALMLPTAGLSDAIRVAERLREAFNRSGHQERQTHPRLTLSVGVAQVTETDDSISLLKRAEAALDAADRRGGDRAYYHDGERSAPITAMLETMDYLS